MSKPIATLAVVLLCAVPAAAQQPTPRALGPKEAVWVRKPTGDDIARYYPERAAQNEVSGWAVIQCRVTAQGFLAQCRVLGEAPRGQNFGAAALKLGTLFKMAPADKNGRSVEGAVVAFPIVLTGNRGAPVPPKDFIAGGPALLVTIAGSANQRAFACPTVQQPGQRCEAHAFAWEVAPSLAETTDLVRGAIGASEKTTLNCGLDPYRRLSGCLAAGAPSPAQEDAMQRLATLFTAPVEADDKTLMAQGRILIDFHWPALRAAIDAQIVTAPETK